MYCIVSDRGQSKESAKQAPVKLDEAVKEAGLKIIEGNTEYGRKRPIRQNETLNDYNFVLRHNFHKRQQRIDEINQIFYLHCQF